MSRSRSFLPLLLICLLVAFTFNAYACLLPLFASPPSEMAGCPDQSNQTPRVFCDSFTTLGPLSELGSQADHQVVEMALADWHGDLLSRLDQPSRPLLVSLVLPGLSDFTAPVVLRL